MKLIAKLKQHRNHEEGFTLIELMIVVVIIGILSAVAVPVFANQQKGTALAAVKSDVKNVVTMATQFKTKDGSFPKTCAEWNEIIPTGWASSSTRLLRVKTTPDGFGLWIEAQPTTIQGSDPSAVRAENTIVYNSERGDGLMTRTEFEQKYSYTAGTALSTAEGYTNSGFSLTNATGCGAW